MRKCLNFLVLGTFLVSFWACGSSGEKVAENEQVEVLYENGTRKANYNVDENGNFHGPGWEYFPDGSLSFQAEYEHGELKGPAKKWVAPGVLEWEGNFEKGQESGYWRYYFTDTGNQTPGKEVIRSDGYFKVYDYDGNFVGRREGTWRTYDRDGNLIRMGVYLEDAEDGLWEEWHPHGVLKSRGNFEFKPLKYGPDSPPLISNQKIGTWQYFDEGGRLVREEKYEDGKIVKTKIFADSLQTM